MSEHLPTKIRESNIEWLRILAMLMIVLSHSIAHSRQGLSNPQNTGNGISQLLCLFGGAIADNIFFFISGYFSVGKKLNIKRIGNLYLALWTYSVIIAGGLICCKLIPFSTKTIVNAITPFSSGLYWFITVYLIISVISPALQTFATQVDRRIFRNLLILLFIFWVLPFPIPNRPVQFSNLGWGIFIYLLAAYLRKYPPFWTCKIHFRHAIATMAIMYLGGVIAFFVIGGYIPCSQKYIKSYLTVLYSLPGLIVMVLLFYAFKNWKTLNSSWVNRVAGCVLGVYLLSSNQNIKGILWGNWLDHLSWYSSTYYPVIVLGCCLLVFSVGIVVELVRQQIMKWMGIDRIFDKKVIGKLKGLVCNFVDKVSIIETETRP